jgi:hypothetical protein
MAHLLRRKDFVGSVTDEETVRLYSELARAYQRYFRYEKGTDTELDTPFSSPFLISPPLDI